MSETDDFDFDEDTNALTVAQIYDTVILNTTVFLVVNTADVPDIQASLTSHKAKETARLKKDNIPHDDSKLKFDVYPSEEAGKSRLRIELKRRKAFSVIVEQPTGGLE